MTETTPESPPIEERPLVTFALFAYNQEKYIREAVEGAFAQTYEPLEIILSDDCSTDRTFEIMEEIAAEYRGSRKLIVRKTSKNCGTLQHVAQVAALSTGSLMVLAAGDDLSKPERTAILAQAWKTTGAWGLCSRLERIDETGRLLDQNATVEVLSSFDYPLRTFFTDKREELKIVHGATSAYDKALFNFLELNSNDYILSEDGALSILIKLLNKDVCYIEQSLVEYRQNENSLTNSAKYGESTLKKTYSEERAIERFARSQANRCILFLRWNVIYKKSNKFSLDKYRLQQEIVKQNMVANWRTQKFSCKVVHVISLRNSRDLAWYLPRLLPEPMFVIAKTIIKNLRSKVKIAQARESR